MKPVGYICNACELLTVEILQEIEKARKEYQKVGVGIHSDAYFLQTYGRNPIKPFEEREKLIKALNGVDFTFVLNLEDDVFSDTISKSATLDDDFEVKKYHVGYAPGTYDLFHEGHLEHLMEVKSLCDILMVGVNSDDLVWKNKQKKTKLPEKDRINVVNNLKFVDYVYLVTTNQKSIANDWAKENIGCPIDVIFVGSDLKSQDFQNIENIPIIFTERDPVLMAKRSSSYYRNLLNKLQKKIN